MQAIQDQIGWTRLHVAVDRQDYDTLRSLLQARAKIDASARNGMTPLHLAARAGDLESVRLLAEAKGALDLKDKSKRTSVQLAVAWAITWRLSVIRPKVGMYVPDLLVAAAAGCADLVQGFLRDNPKTAGEKTESGQTPLHLAAWTDEAKVAKEFVAGRAALEKTNEQGMTPLHVAALVGSVKVAEALLNAKASPEAKMEETGRTPLHLAAAAGQAEMVDLLLNRGAGVDAVDAARRTPLHVATVSGQMKAAERLLAEKATVGARDVDGYTPLHLAVLAEQAPMVKLSCSPHKADLTTKDEGNQSPPIFAVPLTFLLAPTFRDLFLTFSRFPASPPPARGAVRQLAGRPLPCFSLLAWDAASRSAVRGGGFSSPFRRVSALYPVRRKLPRRAGSHHLVSATPTAMARSAALAALFQQPRPPPSRHYEICRAYFLEQHTTEEVAERFHPRRVDPAR